MTSTFQCSCGELLLESVKILPEFFDKTSVLFVCCSQGEEQNISADKDGKEISPRRGVPGRRQQEAGLQQSWGQQCQALQIALTAFINTMWLLSEVRAVVPEWCVEAIRRVLTNNPNVEPHLVYADSRLMGCSSGGRLRGQASQASSVGAPGQQNLLEGLESSFKCKNKGK